MSEWLNDVELQIELATSSVATSSSNATVAATSSQNFVEKTITTTTMPTTDTPTTTSKKPAVKEIIINQDGAEVYMIKNFITKDEATVLMNKLSSQLAIDGHQEAAMMYGKPYVSKRKSLQYKAKDTPVYHYTGSAAVARDLAEIPELEQVCDKIAEIYGERPNLALVMDYIEGDVALGWHSDSEKGLKGSIFGLTLGVTRDVLFRLNADETRKWTFAPPNGSIYSFNHRANEIMKHTVPARKNAGGRRISVTFRFMKTATELQADTNVNKRKK
jgi:hypothetical protein